MRCFAQNDGRQEAFCAFFGDFPEDRSMQETEFRSLLQ
jgi:hypothetical protein